MTTVEKVIRMERTTDTGTKQSAEVTPSAVTAWEKHGYQKVAEFERTQFAPTSRKESLGTPGDLPPDLTDGEDVGGDEKKPDDLTRLDGVTAELAGALMLRGLDSFKKLATAEDEALLALPGIGKKVLERIRDSLDEVEAEG